MAAPIHSLGGDDDVHIAPADLFRWAEHTRAEHRVMMYPGAHFYLYEQFSPIADLLAAGMPATRTLAEAS